MTPGDDFLSKQRLLVISPHADDESFGCAGTMARIKDLGGQVYVMVCSVGDLKHYDGTAGIVYPGPDTICEGPGAGTRRRARSLVSHRVLP